MSNAVLKQRGEKALFIKVTVRIQMKARTLAAAEDTPMNQFTGKLIEKACFH